MSAAPVPYVFSTAEKREFAARMRKNPTTTEKILWNRIRNQQLGWRFRRQTLLFGYIVDFYCPHLKLAVEVDGLIHKKRADQDLRRDIRLAKEGVFPLRINAERMGGYNLETTVWLLEGVCSDLNSYYTLLPTDKLEATSYIEFVEEAASWLTTPPEPGEINVGQI